MKTKQDNYNEMYEAKQTVKRAIKTIENIRLNITKLNANYINNNDLELLEEECKQLKNECFYIRIK